MNGDAREFVEAIDMLDVMPPITGGFLDQTAAFVDALRYWRNEEAHWRKLNRDKAPKHG